MHPLVNFPLDIPREHPVTISARKWLLNPLEDGFDPRVFSFVSPECLRCPEFQRAILAAEVTDKMLLNVGRQSGLLFVALLAVLTLEGSLVCMGLHMSE